MSFLDMNDSSASLSSALLSVLISDVSFATEIMPGQKDPWTGDLPILKLVVASNPSVKPPKIKNYPVISKDVNIYSVIPGTGMSSFL